jgi:hypothetical protein
MWGFVLWLVVGLLIQRWFARNSDPPLAFGSVSLRYLLKTIVVAPGSFQHSNLEGSDVEAVSG